MADSLTDNLLVSNDTEGCNSENTYPTHLDSPANKTCLSAKSEKHPLNGMTKHSSEINGVIGQSPEKVDGHTIFEEAENGTDTSTSELNAETVGRVSCVEDCEDEDCGCSKSIAKDISQIVSNLKSLNMLGAGDTLTVEQDISNGIEYVVYESELQMPDIMRLITKDLSEPYSIYTYRYFIHNWPKLCFLAMDGGKCVGAIVCKLDMHKKMVRRGYIAMLAVDAEYRRKKIGSHLVLKAIKAMIADDCDEVVLETEITNQSALRLYENLGFVRDKRLFRYYLNGVDALRLKLWLR
ncbi:NAA30-like protein [Mya arenaria]|uniref:NAA30-like protein n=1 Tax=Mya arenaria TaxID=6604 RepID=A0ABY7FEM1_MYAAR|nr:N-alpha-acetyltransferase 30-like [Mya arenaria]WAR19206.1 NAA30-like protein [Mya arenaria]